MAQAIVIILPGITGTDLIDSKNNVIWPTQVVSTGSVAQLENPTNKPLVAANVGDGYISLAGFLIAEAQSNGKTAMFYQAPLPLAGQPVPVPSQDPSDLVVYGVGYNWLQDNAQTGASFGLFVSNIVSVYGTQTPIWIVAHSMGGLVARYAVESGLITSINAPNFKGLITLGTPHQGAALALAAITGDLPSALLSQFNLTNTSITSFMNGGYCPSAYQLLPNGNLLPFIFKDEVIPVSFWSSEFQTVLQTPTPNGFGASPADMSLATSFFGKLATSSNFAQFWNGEYLPSLYLVYGVELPTLSTFSYKPSQQGSDPTLTAEYEIVTSGDAVVPESSATFDSLTDFPTAQMSAYSLVDHFDLPSNSSIQRYVWTTIALT